MGTNVMEDGGLRYCLLILTAEARQDELCFLWATFLKKPHFPYFWAASDSEGRGGDTIAKDLKP